MPQFSHLHVHTQFSLLDGAADISDMYKKAVKDNMPAIAITDHGNMFGVFKFVAEATKHNTKENPNTIKPIVGCEFYLVENRHKRQFTKDDKDQRYHQLFLAKNPEGYRNLVKLCSLGYIEGLYGKYPRIDKELVLQYHKGLIATTCCLGASVPRTILRKGEAEGEAEFKWWLDLFGEDYYIELQRHDIPEQNKVNEILLKWAVKYNVKVIASNDSHYVNQEDYNAHDILLCINTGEKQSTPILKDFDDDVSIKGKRFAFYNDQFYFKKTEEMNALFHDVPQAIDNTNEIVGKIQPLKLKQDIMLPHFKIPAGFDSQDEYLRHLTYEGAKARYKELTPEIEERLNFELFTVKTMGFAGYFLIVADFIKAGRDLGVFVGPGRGSAAGSAVAYCIGITNIDPIKYNLLFERFLNPERVSMPDIDIDFDDVGRDKVIDYVVKKYGKDHVAQIITYGSMAAKSSLKDVGRVMDIPLPEVEKVTKAFPDNAAASLRKILNPKGIDEKLKKEMKPEQMQQAENFIKLSKNDDVIGKMIRMAYKLEGSVRNTGIHACGVIITPEELNKYLPVTLGKDSDFLVTQFDNNAMEKSGLLKMDFLGLKTLTIIKNACQMIKENHGVEILPDEIPLDDPKTYELFQKGATSGVFQFESPGMQKHLIALKPNKFEDLIAMNALYRPGPMAYIESFIKRKHGKEAIAYDLPIMSQYLEETYGITVYQEQVMLLSQLLANFTKGEADTLRKAMGKKQKEVLDKMKPRFIEGCAANGHDEKIVEKIWVDWEAFAEYAFNKSHATCYAYLAFHTAYLKANYPSEFMATVLSLNKDNIKDVNFFLSETKRMGIKTLVPDINESKSLFTVNKNGDIRFGLAGIKGVGGAAIDEIVLEREKNGIFNTFFDFTKRVNLRSINKRNLEAMAYAGAFDGFPNVHRAQFFHEGKEGNLVEKGIKYGNYFKEKAMNSLANLFGGSADENIQEPDLPVCDEWDIFKQLQLEKEYTGIYVSGHPLDDYAFEINKFGFGSINELTELKGKSLKIPVLISSVSTRMDAKNRTFAIVNVEDLEGSMEIRFFSEDYIKFGNYLKQGALLLLHGIYNNSKWNEDRYDFRVNEILHLGDLLDKKTKSLEVGLNFEDLDLELVIALEKTLKSYPGKKLCTLELTYFGEKETINFNSRSVLLDICKPLINELDQIPGVRVKIKS